MSEAIACEPTENEERAGETKQAHVFTKQERDFAHAELNIRIAAVLLSARQSCLRRGLTDDMMAGRLGWTVSKWRKSLLNPQVGREISDLALALDVEIIVSAITLDKSIYWHVDDFGPQGKDGST